MSTHIRGVVRFGFVIAMLRAAPGPVSLGDQPLSPARGESRPATKDAVFTKTADGSFDFQTEAVQGTIRLDGAYHGVTRLVDRRTGRQFIDRRYSALNLFKLMAADQAMDMPRTMPRKVEISPQRLEVKWPATEWHRGEITARYEVREPSAVDLTVTARSAGTYPGYELFVSSYFDKALRPHVCLQPSARGPAAGDSELVAPAFNDVFRGAVIVFPRDARAARRCVDGRWDHNERGIPIVQMCPVRRYAHCVAFMADPVSRMGVVLMSSPRHCYAISTRYHPADKKERLTDYSAFDFSLFGDDLAPGDERTARLRLAIVPLDKDSSQPLAAYRAFLSESAAEPAFKKARLETPKP